MSKITLYKVEHSEIYSPISQKVPKLTILKLNERISELSKPKPRPDDEDVVGPGKYDPSDAFLSTKCRSPSPFMAKSSRFNKTKLPALKNSVKKNHSKIDIRELNKSELITSPSFSFQRTGHNLKLVTNQEFPGAGRYSPSDDAQDRGYSFAKAKRIFNWKKGKSYSVYHDQHRLKLFEDRINA